MQGKPYAESPLVAPSRRYGGAGQFDEGKVAQSATPRRGSLLCKGIKNIRAIGMLIASSIASTTAALGAGGEWISVPDAPVYIGPVRDGSRAADGTSWFARTFTNAAEVASARWTVSGLGVFEVFVNGERVGDDFLKPGFTHFKKTKYSFSYDVTGLLKRGAGEANVLAAEVSAGWWCDKIVTPAHNSQERGFSGNKSAFRGELEITYADGSVTRVATDAENWRCGVAGSVTHAAIFDGEEYDARIKDPVLGEGLVKKPEVNTEFAGEILPSRGAEVTLRHDLAMARGPYSLKKGETLVVDFAQNCAAVPEFRFSAKRGTVLTALPAEMLNDANKGERGCDGPKGSVYRENLRVPNEGMRVVYTFAGDGVETYLPRFTFFGYRYLSITATDDVEIESVASVPVTSIKKEMELGKIETGDKDLNRFIKNVYWGQLSNYLSVPTDCPQRNERLGWMQDTQTFCEAASFNANVYDFFIKWMRDVRDSQHENGGFPSVAPFAQYGNESMRVGWADAGVIVPWTMWKQFGDTRIIDENWAAMSKYVSYVEQTKYEFSAIKDDCRSGQYADWLSLEDYEPCNGSAYFKDANGNRQPRPEAILYWNYLGGCYWLMNARMMAEMAAASGRTAEVARWRRSAEMALAHVRGNFVDRTDGMLIGSFRHLQGAALFALHCGILERPEAIESTKAAYRKNLADHGGCNMTGFLGISILMKALTENGMVDVAYNLMLNHKFPSWLYSVDQGATTVWERWNSYTKADGFGPVGMNSFNHYAFGAVLSWIYRTVAGIAADSSAPGFKRIVMAPKPDRRLGYVKAEYKSAAGLIKSAWRYEGDDWVWEFTVPEGANARVTIPGESSEKLYAPGTYKVVKSLPQAADGVAQATAGAFTISKDALPQIIVPAGMRPFVAKAAEDVAGDIEKVFGTRPKVVVGAPDASSPAGNAIVLSKSGSGWENYAVESVRGNVLKITGSDDRGVMFGLYRFASECLGVDPFYRWSGLEPGRMESKTWDGISIRQGDPSFKFRAWFINDEDFLNGFRPDENGRRAIDYPRYHSCFGPSLADEIYETAVRAGFNTVICASYVDILNPDEKRLVDVAASRGLYVTMHHQEPVGAGALQLDARFPEIRGTTYASHPDLWRKAWRRYVEEWAKVPDVIWQLGLRGRKDLPFWVDYKGNWKSPDVSEAEDRRRAGLISSAMADQLAMIEEALGRRPRHFATQLWMEGSEYYRRGFLEIPDGAIVVFSDNCPGLKFQSDIGGVDSLGDRRPFGLYYHLAIVCGNHRCELVPPLRTHQVLGDAWRKGARELVLFNVSNVRPFLYTIEAASMISRDVQGFDAAKFRDGWTEARFGGNAPAVARAVDLYFSAYETELSRDEVSSYGSPRLRAPLAVLNDGFLCSGANGMIGRLKSPARGALPEVVSQYLRDPDQLTAVPPDLHSRVNQDMFPDFLDPARAGLRARAQSAAFARCSEQLTRASKGLGEAQRRQLFERFGYPAEFMRLSSEIFAELSCAVEAKNANDSEACRAHVESALGHARTRDALDLRYNAGRWSRWYDRDLIYPCASVSDGLRDVLLRLQDGKSFDVTVSGGSVERVDFGPGAAGGYAEFEVVGLDAEASNTVLRVAYACHPDGLSEKGDFWRETSARYLGPNVDLPILPANIDRYELYTLDHLGRYRAKLLQGLVRYARFSLDSQRGAVAIRNFRLVNDKVHSEGERAGSFTCSDSRLSQLWGASVRTCELSAIPSYMATHVTPNVKTFPYLADGAKRDRLVWSGDLWFAERTCFYGFSPQTPYVRGSIDMLAANQTPEGYIQASPWPEQPAPKEGEWGPFGSDEFACWFVPVLQDYYLHTADVDTLKRNYPKVVKLMSYLAKYQRPDGIFEQRKETCKHAAGLVFGGTSLHHRSYMNILLWKTYVDAAYLADAMGAADGERWRKAADLLAAAIRKSFWKDGRDARPARPRSCGTHDPTDCYKGFFAISEEDSQMGFEANALALATRFATAEEAAAMMPRLVRVDHGKFQQLAARGKFEYGDAKGALKMLEDHNWYKLLDESWKGPRLTSECMHLHTRGWGDEAHPDTCVASLYTNYVLGITPLEPGFRVFAFNPLATDLIDSASGEVPTPHGVIKAEWWHEGGKLRWKVTPPPGTRCETDE